MNKLAFLLLALIICETLTETVQFGVIYRDFTPAHPDFEININNLCTGMVQSTLDSDKKPVLNPTSLQPGCSNIHNIFTWYRDTSYSINIPGSLNLTKDPDTGVLTYSNSNFFPIDGKGWGTGYYGASGHNFHFTMEMHTTFTYQGGEKFDFTGDDDVWVFINGKLAVDIGGIHGPESKSIKLDDAASSLGITKEGTYDFDFFFAERHTSGSNLILTTSIALVPPPPCTSDKDGDSVLDCYDNCPDTPNPDQRDCNLNGIGDACDSVRAPFEYPFITRVYDNYDTSASTTDTSALLFGQTISFKPLSDTSAISINFGDPLPNSTLSDLTMNVEIAFQNNFSANCKVSIQFSSTFGSSEEKQGLITPGDYFLSRNYSEIDSFFNFLYAGFYKKGKQGDGTNTLTIKSESPECNGNLSVGSVVIAMRYTYQSTNKTGYYSKCIESDDPCLYGTYRFGGYCACWSGAYGRFCTMDTAKPGTHDDFDYASTIPNAWRTDITQIQEMYYKLDYDLMAGKSFYRNFTDHPTCPNLDDWQKVHDLDTDGVVNLDSAYFEDQFLTMFVSQPFVDGRADGAVFLNYDNDDILPYIDCYYPRSNYIYKLVDGCRDVWKFQVPWNSAQKCLWNRTDEDAYTIYRGRVVVHNLEWIGLDQWRIIHSVLRAKLRFQRLVSVESGDISLFNDRVQKAAITKQLVALSLGDPALIEIGTTSTYPYKLTSFNLTVYPNEKIAAIDQSSDDCTVTEGQACRQNFRTSLTLTEGSCTLDGSYRLNFSVGCGSDVPECSLQVPSDFVASVDYTLHSENFCAEITVDVGIVGNIKIYESADWTTLRSSFIVGRTGYFLVAVNSDLNEPKNNGAADPDLYEVGGSGTVMSFSKVEVVNVDIKRDDGQLRIFENKAPVNFTKQGLEEYGTNCKQEDGKQENRVGFSFVFARAALPVPRNGQLKFRIIAEVQATYADSSKKRFALQTSGSDSNSYSVEGDVEDDGSTTITDSGSNTGSGSNSGSGSNTGSGSNSGSNSDSGSGSNTGTGSGTGTGTGAAPDTSNSATLIASLAMLIFVLFF